MALEYAGRGQDEADLQTKIAELIGHGTRLVRVARLTGPRRVEVYAAEQPMRVAVPGQDLLAPGIRRNPVLVEALFDRAAGTRVMLRNRLQRLGYADLEAVRAEGREEGLAQAVLRLLAGRTKRRSKVKSGEPLPAKVRATSPGVFLVPTLRVGMHSGTLRVPFHRWSPGVA